MKNYKRNLLLVFTVPMLLFFHSCSQDDIELEEEINLNELQEDTLLKTLKQLGFIEKDIEDKGDYYLVEGDIVFYKNKKYFTPESGQSSKQKGYPISVTINDVNVYINPGMNSDWINASNDAIDRWNNVNSSLNLNVVSSAINADIEILYDSQDPSVTLAFNEFGMGSWPTLNGIIGSPGNKIWVNPDINFNASNICNRSMTQNDRISNVQHELGHNLGIMHTNQTNGFQIPNTPVLDSQSVMNGGAACIITDFSANDEITIEYLFPLPTFSVSGANLACRFDNLTFSLSGTSPLPSVSTWSVSSNIQKNSSTSSSVSITIPADSRTSGWVKATFSNGSSVTKNIWVGKPGSPASISGPSSVVPGALVNYTSGIADGATTYQWWLPYPYNVSNPIDYFSQDWEMTPTDHRYLTAMTGYGGNDGNVQVMGVNTCGTGGAKIIYVTNSSGSSGGGGTKGGGGNIP